MLHVYYLNCIFLSRTPNSLASREVCWIQEAFRIRAMTTFFYFLHLTWQSTLLSIMVGSILARHLYQQHMALFLWMKKKKTKKHVHTFMHATQHALTHTCKHTCMPACTHSGASLGGCWMRHLTGDQEVGGSTPAEFGNILLWRMIMKYFLRSFSPFCWFKKGSCQFLAKECAQYWLTT